MRAPLCWGWHHRDRCSVQEMLQGLPVLPQRSRTQTLSDRAEREKKTLQKAPQRAVVTGTRFFREGGVSLKEGGPARPRAGGRLQVPVLQAAEQAPGSRRRGSGTEREGDRHRQVQGALHPQALEKGLDLTPRAVGSTQWFQNGNNSNEK